MNKIYDTFRPEGFETINAYLFAQDPAGLIEFFKNALYAEELLRTVHEESGTIMNVIMKIGYSCFMIGQARNQFSDIRGSFYLFAEDVDALHKRALEFGAIEEFEPADMEYGDRQSGIIDPAGNYWWISKRLERKPYS